MFGHKSFVQRAKSLTCVNVVIYLIMSFFDLAGRVYGFGLRTKVLGLGFRVRRFSF